MLPPRIDDQIPITCCRLSWPITTAHEQSQKQADHNDDRDLVNGIHGAAAGSAIARQISMDPILLALAI
jgi:hypothetical protein